MITRIVKLTIEPTRVKDFEEIFVSNKNKIKNFNGCSHLEVLRDLKYPNIFFTYSKWDSPEAVDNYRKSELFGSIWPNAKKLFCAHPEAWSVTNE